MKNEFNDSDFDSGSNLPKKRTNEHLSVEVDGNKQHDVQPPTTKKRVESQSQPVESPQTSQLYCQATSEGASTTLLPTSRSGNGNDLEDTAATAPTTSVTASSGTPLTHKKRVDSHHSVLPLSMQIIKPFWLICCQNCERTKNGRLAPPPPLTTTSHNRSATGTSTTAVKTSTAARTHDLVNSRESVPSFVNNHGDIVLNVDREENGIDFAQPLLNDNHLYGNMTSKMDSSNSINNLQYHGNYSNYSDDTTRLQRSQSNLTQDYDKFHHINTIPPTPQSHTNPILQEYISTTHIYGCKHINPGVLTTIRFSLPTLRVSGSFHDSDMLALSEILFRHCNGSLKHIKRLDFSVASREGKLHGKRGFGSHGAFTLSRVLCISKYIEEVFIQRNRIGPYGAAAMFAAAGKNQTLRTLVMRRCLVGERGALAFAEYIGESNVTGLKEVDLSVNRIGFRGCIAIEEVLNEREKNDERIEVDLEGNLVLQEVMNGVTHGLGIILCVIGTIFLSNRVKHSSRNHIISCGVYSASLLVLYTSSTLYHSFFALKYTRYVFEVLDHCAIYILITGSYTPFLRIALREFPNESFYILVFQWTCCICGVMVEAFYNTWEHKPKFSLAMYLGMGWTAVLCLPQFMEVLPKEAIQLILLGGVGYTSGVPFFVRNNNLDHSIWHCFVLAGSIFHWFAVYQYVAPMQSCTSVETADLTNMECSVS